jgi:hypothetical protein
MNVKGGSHVKFLWVEELNWAFSLKAEEGLLILILDISNKYQSISLDITIFRALF